MEVPSRVVRLRPDCITLWPTEAGTYGLHVRWGGPDGLAQATTIRDAARSTGMAAKLTQDIDASGWTVSVGPLPREEAVRVVETFLL
jgi:hypothetical protein